MMSDRADDALNKLRTALDVEPSAEFTARVRRQLGEAGRSRAWWPGPAWIAVTAVVALIIGAIAVSILGRRPPVARLAAGLVQTAPPAAVTPVATTASEVAGSRAVPPPVYRTTVRASEVLIPAGEITAMRQFMRAIVRGQISVPPAADLELDAEGHPVVLPIPLIAIEPLNPPKTGAEGGIEK